MIQLFNCSCIKNVTLRIDSDKTIELEVTYLDDKENRWLYMKNISHIADRQYYKDKLAKAYSTIKEALDKESRFVEIEL